ncbi:DUF1593 domain-containing protein [Jiulongibacter sediminis]|uniref:Uncharacterized protein n=1 Tax=Jiulongibacter sediminis TaxID=1605367 RepID=A0A0N8H9G9_9BACT|nr:DUF1593 domain-containing protein [Jiulongibacter sediminis]KPM47340.1 hypothetical protein AFM12_16285 [Jiulongibacter sediminis]TBX22897.1 hypothetical protein TK44_16295 [Jiulongibacter sediminis]
MKKIKLIFLTLILGIFAVIQTNAQEEKPRIIITADPELDDNNSLIRFILYSTDLDIEGLVYASSQFHWTGDGKGTKWYVPGREYDRFNMGICPCESYRWAEDERFIHDIVEAYEKSYPNLKTHHSGYPTPEYLKSKIRFGNVEFDGDFSKDSPGSELIRETILDNEPGKLFITSWGGASTIARALKVIQDQYQFTTEWDAIREKINRKVVLLPSGDQDDTFYGYIRHNWPGIEYRVFRDSPNYGYGAQLRANETNKPLLTPAYMTENIVSKGPLGSLYRVWGDGKQMVEGDKVDYFGLSGYTADELRKMGYFVWMPPQEKGSWLGEGDNATFMNMLGNGLRAYEDGTFGGWGGRTIPTVVESNSAFSSSAGSAEQMAQRLAARNNETEEVAIPFPDFFAEAQKSFVARMKWAVTPKYSEANHEPIIHFQSPENLLVNPGQKVKLHAAVSDPDGNEVKLQWVQMPAGTYTQAVEINNAQTETAEVQIPEDAKPGQTMHFILKATDNGSPALTRYQRVILEIRNR